MLINRSWFRPRPDMSLKETTETALVLTERLQLALTEGQFDQFTAILVERNTVMVEFQAAHEAASNDDRAACGERIVALQQNDAKLQEEAGAALTAAGDQMRTNLGATPHYNGSYGKQPELACVDRKA